MKRRHIVYLFSALMLLSSGKVNAANFNVGDKVQVQNESSVDTSGFTFGSFTYDGELKSFITSGNEKFISYCEDPSKPSAPSSQPPNYKVERILGTYSQGDNVNAFDNGILTILSKGYNQFNNSLRTDSGLVVSGDDLYLATSIASRAFVYANAYNYSTPKMGSYYNTKAKGILTVAVRWASMYYGDVGTYSSNANASIKKCTNQKCVKNTLKNIYSWYDESINLTPAANGSRSYNIILAAQYLFKLGVKAQSDYMEGLDNKFSISVKIDGNSSASEEKVSNNKYATVVNVDENNKGIEDQYMYATIDVKNLVAQTGYINNIKVDCPTCSSDGITIGDLEYSIDSGDWQTLPDGLNVAQYLKEENGLRNGKIGIRFLYKNSSSDSECTGTSFTLNYEYYNTGNDIMALRLGAVNNKSQTGSYQRHFVIINSAGNSSGSVSGKLGCGNNNACKTELQVPVCSEDSEKSTAKVTGPEDVKKCILGETKTDEAGNHYLLSEENGGVKSSNPYCKVFCKEDYAEIKLNPIIENVVCGGYFQLKSKVSGTKTCYTGSTKTDNSIDKEQFLKDVIDAQKMMINAISKYNEAKAAEDAFDSNGEVGCTDKDDNEYYSYRSDFEFEELTINSIDQSTGYVSFSKKTTSKSYSGKYNDKNPRCHKEDGEYEDGDSDAITDRYEDLYDEAEELYDEGSELFENAIAYYNGCTSAWLNNFKFLQKIKYYYDEYRYDSPKTPYYDLLSKLAEPEKAYYLEAVEESLKTKSTITICTGQTDEKYNCSENQTITLDGSIDDGLDNLDSYNYNEEYGSNVFKINSFTYCDLKHGCKEKKQAISQATFVKKTVEKEQSYITPTTFYQISVNGKIMTYEGFEKDKVQAAALKNALPVSTSAVGGGQFKLMLEDFGEFYDEKNMYGRIFDFNGENEKSSIAASKKDSGIETFTGEYTCHYNSPCRPKECPNCEFICDDDVCEWKECPTCKFTCVNCVFNFDELKLNVKTISTTNFDSVGRTFGYNWITSSSMKALELLNNKASKTISEIKETNEMVYQDDKTSEDSSLAFSVKMTPEVTREILKWNEEGDTKGGYLDSTLTCYDAVIDGQTYKNIYCYSKNIDKLVDDFSDEVTVINRPNTDAERKNYTKYKESDKGYWTLWEGFLTLNKNEVGSAVKTNEETGETYQVLGGPSWK